MTYQCMIEDSSHQRNDRKSKKYGVDTTSPQLRFA
jgi:hypothetical protein